MAFNPLDIVGEIKESTKYGAYRITKYIGKVKKDHMYEVVFLRSGHKKEVGRTQARKGSIVDDMAAQLKKKAKKSYKRKKVAQLETKNEIIYLNKKIEDSVILSIDQSTSATGYAIYHGKKLVDYGIYAPLKTEPTDVRINLTKKKIRQLIDRHCPDAVIMESVYLGINANVLFVLSCLYGVVKDLCLEEKVPCIPISAPEWKGKSGILKGSRDQQKQLGVDVVKATYGITVPHDISDAIIIGAMGIKHRINFRNHKLVY